MPYYISPPPMNPLSRLLAAILAVLALVGAFFFGIFVLAFAAGIGLIAWLLFSIRLWWLRKKGAIGARMGPDSAQGQGPVRGRGESGRDITDVEYTVVSRRDEDDSKGSR
jgi:hypothetical protein